VKKNNDRRKNILEGKRKMPEYNLIFPNIFGHFVPKFGEIQSFSEERNKVLI